MAGIATKQFTFNQVVYGYLQYLSDGLVTQLLVDGSYGRCFLVLGSSVGSGGSGGGSGGNSGGGSSGGSSGSSSGGDMPLAAAYFNIPASASTHNVQIATPTRVVGIHNTDSAAQGAVVALLDCNAEGNISAAHQIGAWELGPGQNVADLDIPCVNGLTWVIKQGSNGSTALNSTGNGVDVTYAAV